MVSGLLSLLGHAYGQEGSRHTQNFQSREAIGAKGGWFWVSGSKGPLFPMALSVAVRPVTALPTPSSDSQLRIQSTWSLAMATHA